LVIKKKVLLLHPLTQRATLEAEAKKQKRNTDDFREVTRL